MAKHRFNLFRISTVAIALSCAALVGIVPVWRTVLAHHGSYLPPPAVLGHVIMTCESSGGKMSVTMFDHTVSSFIPEILVGDSCLLALDEMSAAGCTSLKEDQFLSNAASSDRLTTLTQPRKRKTQRFLTSATVSAQEYATMYRFTCL
ncbi:MAG: hypothetical protein HOM58_05800 [Rhodospirillaceae bacterium]|jgi:hypothetical protein|nr:hypothetical protein [Rhodospirillaceae bacterium]MBT5456972.1 hypothetical protein [Rhodospirillaceae bacterium]